MGRNFSSANVSPADARNIGKALSSDFCCDASARSCKTYSSLGQHLVWDLDVLYAERCALLREVWKSVPVVWKDGQAVAKPPPAGHACMAESVHPEP